MTAPDLLDPRKTSQVRLFGRRATNAEVAKYCATELYKAGGNTKSELAASLNMSRPTLNRYLRLAAHLEKVPLHTKLLREGPKAATIPATDKAFRDHPLIVAWIDNMQRRSLGGKPFKGITSYIRNFYVVCKTLNVAPQYWLMGSSLPEVLEHARQGMAKFMEEYHAGRAAMKRKSLKVGPAPARPFAIAVRDFMRINGYNFPKGEPGVMSLSIAAIHGKYADLKITEEHHQHIKSAIEDRYGRGSPEWFWYMLGLETFARQKALIKIKTDFETLEARGKKVLAMRVYESKTAQYRGGLWIKHIFDPELITELEKITGRTYVFEDQLGQAVRGLNDMLRERYRAAGLDKFGRAAEDDPDSSYFIQRPTHALRHAGVQRLLVRSKWNVGYVAKHGWKTAQELVASYGEMPPEYELSVLEDMAI